MKSSKAQIHGRFHKTPEIRFEDQRLTSFSGLLIFQALFQRLHLKARLKRCFRRLNRSPIFSRHLVLLLLIIHLLLGFRRLRDVDYYRDDPLVMRLLGLRRLPDVSTISRALSEMDDVGVEKFRELSRALVIEGLRREGFPRLTFDFDGSVLSTGKHAEGTAVGFNPKRKGSRSYYPLFCTVAQTGQFFDMHHRSGNAHDSNGAADFMTRCFDKARREFAGVTFESRIDGAFFQKKIMEILDDRGVEFTASVPFSHMPELKKMIENRRRWRRVDGEHSFFETGWKPKSWDRKYRFLFVRKRVGRQEKGVLQLDLFEPRDFNYEYKVIVTNKRAAAKAVITFHNGRGSQERIFGDAKQSAALGDIPTFNLAGNKTFTLCSMMAHNFSHEIQMLAEPRARRAGPKRPTAWAFQTLDTLRHRIIQRAGRITHPQGKLTLTMSANPTVKHDLLNFLDAVQKTA